MPALPPSLALLLRRWTDEDSAARRTRRAQDREATSVDAVVKQG